MTHWSEEQYRRWTGKVNKKGASRTLPPALHRPLKFRSKTEGRFAAWLDGPAAPFVTCWDYEPINLRLAPKTFWLPDFSVVWDFGQVLGPGQGPTPPIKIDGVSNPFKIPAKTFIQVVDVKHSHGNARRTEWKDDTRVKIKAAAWKFRNYFHVVAATWMPRSGLWEFEEFKQ